MPCGRERDFLASGAGLGFSMRESRAMRDLLALAAGRSSSMWESRGSAARGSVRTRTYVRTMHWREQGDKGEWAARDWYAAKGAGVFMPLGHTRDYDFVADVGGELVRVQVKTSGQWVNDRWNVTTCTRGGNRSWKGTVKRLDAASFDQLFVLAGDGRCWRIPAKAVDGRSRIVLGGPQYAEWEVESAPKWAWKAAGS